LATVFLSYSTKDRELANNVRARLLNEGFEEPFIDYHPEDGIPAGADWASDLRRRIAMCQALIFLCSPSSVASMWCFSEVQQAQALGKHVFVVSIATGGAPFVTLSAIQRVSLVDDPETGWKQFLRGLQLAGLSGLADLAYKTGRPPWPGLGVYEEVDAAVYEGRGRETADGLAALAQMHSSGQPRSFVIAGASGTGKSSLLRAGIAARLRKNEARWCLIGPFRARSDGVAAFDRALAEVEAAQGLVKADGPAGDVRSPSDRMRILARHVRGRAGHADRAIAIVVDPLDDVFVETTDETFLQLLDDVLRQDHVFLASSIQSPLLDRLQAAKGWNARPVQIFSLGRLLEERLADVIERPASTAGLQWEPGMVARLVALARGNDALPLLSFTLARLHNELVGRREHRFRAADLDAARAGLEQYLADTADRLVNSSGLDERALAAVFLRLVALATSNAGDVVTRVALSPQTLPLAETKLIDALVTNRILARGDNGAVEVAHDALFRTWPRLAGWIAQHRTFLSWRADLGMQRRAHATGTGVLLSGRALSRAHSFRADFDRFLDGADRRYLRASVRARWLTRGSIAVVALAAAGVVFWIAQWRLGQERTRERARQVDTDVLRAGDESLALEHALSAVRDVSTRDLESRPEFARALILARVAARQVRDFPVTAVRVFGCKEGLLVVDRASIALHAWSAIAGPATFRVASDQPIERAFCADPKGRFVTSDHDGNARVWTVQDATHASTSPLAGKLEGKYGKAVLLEPENSHTLSVHSLESGLDAPFTAELDLDSHDSLATDPDGRLVAVVLSLQADPVPNVHVIDALDPNEDNVHPSVAGVLSRGLYFSPHGSYVAALWAYASAHVWRSADYQSGGATIGGDELCDVAFSDDERMLVTLSDDGRATAFRQPRDSRDDTWLQVGARAVANPSMCSVAVSPAGDAVFIPRGGSLRRWTVEPAWADSVRTIPEPQDATQLITASALQIADDGGLSALGRETLWRWRARDSTRTSAPSRLIDDVMRSSFYAADLGAQVDASSTPVLLAPGDGTRVPLSLPGGRLETAWVSSAAHTAVIVSHDEVSLFDFTGKRVHGFQGARGAALVHGDSQVLVATASAVERWALEPSPRLIDATSRLPAGVRLVAASDDGSLLLILDASVLRLGRVVSDGQIAVSDLSRDGDVTHAVFSLDGRRLVTATSASVKFWNVSDDPVEVYAWTGRYAAWAVSPNHRWLAISRVEGGIEIYDLSLENLIRSACAEATDRGIWHADEAPCHASDETDLHR
jgi:WD40 repeat protein